MATNAERKPACDPRELALAAAGKRAVEWTLQSMPVLQAVRKQFIKSQPLAGMRVAGCFPINAASANLAIALRDIGASVSLCGPSQDEEGEVGASLTRDSGIDVVSAEELAVSDPHFVLDSDARVMLSLRDNASALVGATETTARGIARLQTAFRASALTVPVLSIAESETSAIVGAYSGAGQGILERILTLTGRLLAGGILVVAGYGATGRGIAKRARGLGAQVLVTEVDPSRALEAALEGFRVVTMNDAAALGEIFVTATGNRHVLAREQFARLKDNAVLCHAGAHDPEIDFETLGKMAISQREARPGVDEYRMGDGRRLLVLSRGRGAPFEDWPEPVLDLVNALQVLSIEHLARNRDAFGAGVHAVPAVLEKQVARLKLEAMHVQLDRLTPEQERYLTAE